MPQYGMLKTAWAAQSRLLAISDQLGPGVIAEETAQAPGRRR